MPLDFRNLPETGFSDEIEQQARAHFTKIASNVDAFVEKFRALPDHLLFDDGYLERFVVEYIGLNNESLGELPPELSDYFGTGLYIWQNPRQFARYLSWLLSNACNCTTYLEIGSRWGGTFITTCEVLRRTSPNFNRAIAVDLINKPPFIKQYEDIQINDDIEIIYHKGSSTSDKFAALVKDTVPDISLIDGDHSLAGALKDHMLIRQYSKIIVHHDICSDTCPDSTLLWNSLKQLEKDMHYTEFTEQYQSLKGCYFGIGVFTVKQSF